MDILKLEEESSIIDIIKENIIEYEEKILT